MNINVLPHEILSSILEAAVAINAKEGVTYTYGLSQAPLPAQKAKLNRYLRGPVCPDDLLWDATASIRQVCSRWHDWALSHSLKQLWVRRWRGSERWAELSMRRQLYDVYELIEKPSGYHVYRDPFGSLKHTEELFAAFPNLAKHARRLWFNGFYTASTDRLILSVLRSCRKLTSVSIPWALLRHGTADEWAHLLGVAVPEDPALQTLELQAIDLSAVQERDYNELTITKPLLDPRVDFSNIKRLKLVGDTTWMPITDVDLIAMACTATNLEELLVTNMSTVTIEGVMALIKASQSSIRIIEHSPLSNDGFFRPHPGVTASGEHICETLTQSPKLRDLSISVPSACECLFAHEDVAWEGECQVRASALCGTPCERPNSAETQRARAAALRDMLDRGRSLISGRARQRRALDIEFFFAECIFDLRDCVVHGDFALAEISSGGRWPLLKTSSPKGPYGTTGLYGKDEGTWDIISEAEFFTAVEKGWLRI
ncbi:hypothetical protein AAFC00_001301 [Neodothiora populina]|uniref:F-box domain-containing protein n=1 Tax=Neodothiora populina TaxID=2781224 RepID=A0ABR3PPH3_9PEZI